MKRQRIYVDTSVFGGCFDREFATWSVALMNDFRTGRYGLVVSDVTASEIAKAPEEVRDLYDELLNSAEELKVAPEALGLLRAYETQGVLPPRYRADMLHIALATVAEVDVLVSWNFSHIVRLDKIRLFNGVNLQMGYKPLTIYSPREVATHEQED
jgi:predicted nucleic acid-binding protein